MSSLYDIKVEDVVKTDNILFFEYTDIAVYIQIFKMFFPLVKPNHSDNLS
jgi:hypothetical protein